MSIYGDNTKASGGTNYLTHTRGFLSWALTLDHKRIGVMYLVSILTAFFFAGMAAMAIRTELIAPGEWFLSQDNYNQMFSVHGALMVFLVIIPSVPAAMGNFVLPIMLGAKDVASPRL
ncbi:MAG: cbb3-type cytochrome c oxidase subunit I, partial [Planctomycetes bacterium]|nr:cbb3-type cytochrome c oxidase subunit I [Planctomycetota bacterium]